MVDTGIYAKARRVTAALLSCLTMPVRRRYNINMDTDGRLKEMLAEAYGARAEDIFRGFSVRRKTTFRANTLKTTHGRVRDELVAAGISFEEKNGAFAAEADDYRRICALGIYGRGEIYMQNLSSMLPPYALGAEAGDNVLDMCAAPGGKTSQISALSGGRAFITACEKDRFRAERMKHNFALLGVKRTNVLVSDALSLDPAMKFDRVLLDAPCTGSGTVTPSSPGKFSEKLLSSCVKLQRRLIIRALELLKNGGTLVYSTCSLLPAENDGVASLVLGSADPVPAGGIPEGASLLPSSVPGALLIAPDEYYEGFFVAKFVKRR